MLNKNRTEKSLVQFVKYGIGEVMLVVIGILIAVSINNCNENRRQNAELSNIYQSVKENLENDIAEIDTMLLQYEERVPLFEKVLGDSISRADYEENWQLAYLTLGYPELTIDQRGYKLLLDFNSAMGMQKEELVSRILEFYTERLKEIGVDDEVRKADFYDNFYYWKNNFPWWQDYLEFKKVDGFLDYASSDQDYKNRVATHRWLTYDIFLPELREFKAGALAIIKSIDARQ